MKTQMSLIGTVALFLLPQAAFAEALPETSASKVLVETDPVTFALAGYSAHVRVPIPDTGWVLGAGTYGLKLPDFVAELHPDNANGDFHLEMDKSYSTFFDYHFSGRPEGWFAGVQTALQRHRVSQGSDPGATEIGVAVLMPRVGYLLHPVRDSGFYVLPWFGVGPAFELYRTNGVARDYRSLPVLAFGTLHVGWGF